MTVGSLVVMAGRDGGSGGGDKQQDSSEPEGEVTGHSQADKAKAQLRT